MRLRAEAGSEGQGPSDAEALRRELERLTTLAARDRSLLAALLEHGPQGLMACDAEGRLTVVNRAAERMWAGSATVGSLAEWGRYRAFHPEGTPLVTADWPMVRCLETGRPVEPEELEIERFDGVRGLVLTGAAPILDPEGQVAGALGLFADITRFRERERVLLEREQRATTRLARLQTLTAALSESVTPRDVARAALEHVHSALGALDAGLWVVREGGQAELLQEVGLSPEQRVRSAAIRPGHRSPVADCLRDGEAVWLGSRAELERSYPALVQGSERAGALTCLPLQVKGRCVGAMALTLPGDQAFTGDDRAYLLVATRNTAQALERARLFEAERRARADAVAAGERSAFLSEASALLASSLEYEATLARVARLAVPRVADWCLVDMAEDLVCNRGAVVVAHADPAKVELARELGRRFPADPGAPRGAPAVLRTGRPELVAEVRDELLVARSRDPEHLRVLRELGARSAMVVPMNARGRTLGVITLVAAESGRRYGRPDLEMAEDLAHRVALAVDNARLYEQAQEAVRAREEVVAVVSHDLKNPLNAILMSSGLLRRSAGDPGRVQHHAEAIERAVARMRDLVRDLLDLARLEAGRFPLDRQPHELVALAAEAIAMFQPLAQAKSIALTGAGSADGGATRALCDRQRILQVFSNLIGNALAFTPPGGDVTVHCWRSGDDVVTAVVDSGPGIPDEEQRHVFDRFWRARSAGQGTGLGLSIAKGIVDAHGGHIWVESRPGHGAGFLFTLPGEKKEGDPAAAHPGSR